jgi:hypothetical protein
MATFPSITPNTRVFSLGNYPQQEYSGISGGSVRFLYGAKRIGQKLTFSYSSITETETNAIYDHYDEQQGGLIPFDLPAVIWAGYSNIPVSAVDYQWRYASTPAIEPTITGRFSLTIELESVVT